MELPISKYLGNLIFGLLFVLGSPVHAQERPGASAPKAVHGKVIVDGAAVYANPDFDSEVIDYLNQGTVVTMTVKQYSGPSGLGLFHKVRTPGGKIGYITDTDISTPKDAGAATENPKKNPHRTPKPTPPSDEPPDQVEDNHRPMFLTRYLGIAVAMVDYSEKFQGKRLHQNVPFFGLRMTGPETLLGGLPLDVNIGFYPKPPSYLSDFGEGSASGFLMIGDIMVFLPFIETRHSLWTYGLGVMWTFSSYKVTVNSQDYPSQDLRMGADLGVGYGYRFGKNAVRADVKFYIEKSQYFGEFLSFQREF